MAYVKLPLDFYWAETDASVQDWNTGFVANLPIVYTADKNNLYIVNSRGIQQINEKAKWNSVNDPWSMIINRTDGYYNIKAGDIFWLDFGKYGVHPMEMVGRYKDWITVNGKNNSQTYTFISKDIIFTKPMQENENSDGEWANSSLRDFLNNDIYNSIPEFIRNAIVSVDKTYGVSNTSSNTNVTKTITDKIWIPSVREIYGTSTIENVYNEESGATYSTSEFLNKTKDRVKYHEYKNEYGIYTHDAYAPYWLRSSYISEENQYRTVGANGKLGTSNESNALGVAIGFCIN